MTSEMGEGSRMESKKYSALIVDDMPIIRTIEQVFLGNRGFKTVSVENGKEALQLFLSGNCFDIVLMDLEMPIMNGIQATQQIRGLGAKTLIFGTTSAGEESIKDFKAAGLDECFPKPIDNVHIDMIIDRLLGN